MLVLWTDRVLKKMNVGSETEDRNVEHVPACSHESALTMPLQQCPDLYKKELWPGRAACLAGLCSSTKQPPCSLGPLRESWLVAGQHVSRVDLGCGGVFRCSF